MKKLFPASATRPSFISIQSARAKAYVFGVILLTSCTSTQVRWDAVKMRQDVMVYYNDQIMENLIRAKNRLPFVHVDIQTLTSSGASSVTGSIGYGESITNTGTRAQTNQTTATDVTSTSPTGPSPNAYGRCNRRRPRCYCYSHCDAAFWLFGVTDTQRDTDNYGGAGARSSSPSVSRSDSSAGSCKRYERK